MTRSHDDDETRSEADDDRDAIVARRNRFVAAALAGLAGAAVAACDKPAPSACLSVTLVDAAQREDASVQPASDAATRNMNEDAGASAAGEADAARPQPCLSIKPQRDAAPTPCLKIVPPRGNR